MEQRKNNTSSSSASSSSFTSFSNTKSKQSNDSLSTMMIHSNNVNNNNTSNVNKIEIRIKSNVQNSNNNGNKQDVTLSIPTSYNVNQLKDEIRNQCFHAECGSDTSSSANDNNIHSSSNNSSSTSSRNSRRTKRNKQIGRDRYLRLICSGRLLAPDSSRLTEFDCLKDGSVIHAVLAAPGVRGGQQAALSRDSTSRRQNSNNRLLRGIGIGSNGLILPRRNNNGDDDDDDEEEDIEEGRQRRGFDRLRANGMSRNEIAALRTYFSRHVDRFIEQQNQLNNTTQNNDDPRLYRLQMEEQWMNRQGPYSEFRLNTNTTNTSSPIVRSRAFINGLEIDTTTGEINSDFRSQPGSSMIGALGTNRDLMWGFVLGYSFGFLTLFISWLPTVPHKQRVGILSGFCFHMILRILERQERQAL